MKSVLPYFKKYPHFIRWGSGSADPLIFSPMAHVCQHFVHRNELSRLQRYLEEEPRGMLTIVGPINSGKTTLLRAALEGRPVAYINLEQYSSINTIEELIRIMFGQFKKLNESGVLKSMGDHLGGLKAFGFEITMQDKKSEETFGESRLRELSSLFEHTERALEKLNQYVNDIEGASLKSSRPAIVIVGGNKLRPLAELEKGNSSDEGRRALKLFVRWCAHITKHRKLCHVLFTSNDGLFVLWLQHRFALSQSVVTLNVSDPTTSEAKEYILKVLASRASYFRPLLNVDVKTTIHSVGTRFYDLQHVLTEVSAGASLENAVESFLSIQRQLVFDALRPHAFRPRERHIIKWTSGEWWAILKIMTTKGGIINYYDLIRTVFMLDTAPLHSLIHHGVLVFSPPSINSHKALVTVPNHLFLAAMHDLLANHPHPLLVILTRLKTAKGYTGYRRTDLNEFGLADLKACIRATWKLEDTVDFSITAKNIELYRDIDVLRLSYLEELTINFIEGE